MSGGVEPSQAAVIEAVLSGDEVATRAAVAAAGRAMAAAGAGAGAARAAAEGLAAVHARARAGRPLTADLQRALDGAVEVGAATVPGLAPWVVRLRVRTFDEARLARLLAFTRAVSEAGGQTDSA
jgi:hypothetical protein